MMEMSTFLRNTHQRRLGSSSRPASGTCSGSQCPSGRMVALGLTVQAGAAWGQLGWRRRMTRVSLTAFVAACLLILLCGALMVAPVGAQESQQKQYKQLGSPLKPSEVRQLESSVSRIVRGDPINTRELGKYYVVYVIGSMTHPSAWNDPEFLPGLRKRVVSDLHAMADEPRKHDFVRDKLIFNYAKRLVQSDEYSPIARYNALLLIGALNEREMVRRPLQPAVPLAKATDLLLNVANNQSGALKVGALIGLKRHAKLQAAAGQKIDSRIMGLMVQVLKQQPSDPDVADEIHWMQRIAVEVIGYSGMAGAIKVLEPIVGNDSLPMYLRCAAAEAMGQLDFSGATIDQRSTAKNLGRLAIASLMGQIDKLQAYAIENPGGVRPDGGRRRNRPVFNAEGEEGEDEPEMPVIEDPFILQFRRQLKHQLTCVSEALTAIAAAQSDTSTQNLLTSIQSDLARIDQVISVKGSRPDEMFQSIRDPAVQLEAKIQRIPS